VTAQPVVIHGTRCLLQKTGGGPLTSYVVTDPRGAVLAQQAARFIAIAKAAEALRTRTP
jgi:hypothetical protein